MVVIARLQSALEAEINDNTQLRLAKDNIHDMYITVRWHSMVYLFFFLSSLVSSVRVAGLSRDH